MVWMMRLNVSAMAVCWVGILSSSLQAQTDGSHTPAEALKQGAPSVDKDWLAQDYANFQNYLNKLEPQAYPTKQSEKSSALFDKLIQSVEQAMFKNRALPLGSRIPAALVMQTSLNKTLLAYLKAHNGGNDFSLELTHLMGLSFSISRQVTALVNEFVPTLDPKDPTYAVRMDGLKKMKNGVATQLNGGLVCLTETKTYSDEERMILCRYMLAEFPILLNGLPKSVQTEFQVKIAGLEEKETSAGVKKLLTQLAKKTDKGTSKK